MTNDSAHVVFHLDPDPLLLGVLRSAVQFQAAHVGFGAETCAEFAKASEDVCRETISQLNESGERLDVNIDTFPDRIEVCIYRHGQMGPAVGLECFAFSDPLQDGKDRLNGVELLSRVDRVLFSTEDGVARTTLVKFLHSKH